MMICYYYFEEVIYLEALTSMISVQVDSYDKETANAILKKLGLNMSTYVNIQTVAQKIFPWKYTYTE